MGKVIILNETTEYPLTLMGQRAGVCWGGDIQDNEKNYKRGLDCLDMSQQRLCSRANWEYRGLMKKKEKNEKDFASCNCRLTDFQVHLLVILCAA